MAQARGTASAHVAATAVLIMVTISSIMLIHCQVAEAKVQTVPWAISAKPYGDIALKTGDSIKFTYAPNLHNAVSAGKDGKCFGKGVATTKGSTTVGPFNTAGTFYYICSIDGHCDGGKMKVKVIITKPRF